VASLADDAAAVAIAEVNRPFYCNSSASVFVECFMCGRLANDTTECRSREFFPQRVLGGLCLFSD